MRGYLRRRGRESWSLVVDLARGPDGRRRQKRYTLKGTKKTAEASAAQILTSINHVEPAPSLRPVRECLAAWLATREARVAASTYRRYKSIVDVYLVPTLGPIQIGDLRPVQIESSLKTWRSQQGPRVNEVISERTVRHIFDTLRSALKYCTRCELIRKNPCDAVERPRVVSGPAKSLEVSELRVLLDGLENTDLRAPAAVAAGGGFRRGELLGLVWNDVDVDKGIVHVQHSLFIAKDNTLKLKLPKTKKSRRYVALPNFALEALVRHRDSQQLRFSELGIGRPTGDTPVFDALGSFWNPDKFSARFYYTVHSRHLPTTNFHGLRHTYASLSMQSGTPLKVTSEGLGHSSVATTADLYINVISADQLKAAERLQSLWDEAQALSHSGM